MTLTIQTAAKQIGGTNAAPETWLLPRGEEKCFQPITHKSDICLQEHFLEEKNLLTVNKRKVLSALLGGAVICVFLSLSLVKRGAPGSMYTGCSLSVYTNLTKAAASRTSEQSRNVSCHCHKQRYFCERCRMTQQRAGRLFYIFTPSCSFFCLSCNLPSRYGDVTALCNVTTL